MRIMTWNVNGIKTLVQYSPWNALKTYENILNELGADIICFQETKITKKQVDRSMAVLPSYDSFFSSYSRKPERGYSGTCIFTKRAKCVPVQAEEGISGLLPLDRRPEPSADELIGGTLSSETIALNMQDVRTIDLEGRTTMVDLGLFVLINCYFPNETNEDRLDFKLAFNSMFEARVLALIRAGREVIALGDVNIAAQPIDHCDPVRRASESTYGGYEHHPARKWFNEFTGERGSMVDLARHFHPTKKSMFTHWETRINARETNYGTRIDYILATPGLLPWIKSCDIQPQVIGSDHCPVIADLHDSIVDEAGNTLHLYNYTNPPGRHQDPAVAIPEPPKLAAKFYPEFGSEQKLLSTFFGKNSKKSAPLSTPDLDLSLQDSAVASGSGRASDTVAEPAVVALPFAGTEAKRSTTVAPILPSSLLETSHITKDSSNPPLPKALPPASSIDLTLAMSDDDDDILPQASTSRSVSTSLLNSSSQPSSARLSQTKTKKEPAGKSKASKVGKKDSKGKGKEKQQSPIDTGENGIVNGNHAAPDRAIDLDEEEPQGGHHDVEVEDESLRDLREKAMNGSRPSSSMKKRRKSLDFGADEEAAIRESIAIADNGQASTAWSSIFTAKVPPLCTSHQEPCKQWTVNKSGPNKNRVFWLCARPVGEGYDNGQKSAAEINPAFRCNYFKWESDIKRTAPASTASGSGAKKQKRTPGGG